VNKCRTCTHWQKEPEGKHWGAQRIIEPEDIDTGEYMEMPFEVRYCKCPRILFCERPVESCGASVADGSGYNANLLTGPEFGCLLHETGGAE